MESAEALVTALAMVSYPHLTGRVRASQLPKGITYLLQVAAGDNEALSKAKEQTGQTDRHLKKAAGFFVEQILLSQPDDYYRVLGCNRTDATGKLRQHMALIMKWLHPDAILNDSPSIGFDRSLYANHITEAWEALKTEDRRAAYNTKIDARIREHPASDVGAPKGISDAETRRRTPLYRVPPRPIGFWSHFFSMFIGRS